MNFLFHLLLGLVSYLVGFSVIVHLVVITGLGGWPICLAGWLLAIGIMLGLVYTQREVVLEEVSSTMDVASIASAVREKFTGFPGGKPIIDITPRPV